MMDTTYADLTLDRAVKLTGGSDDADTALLHNLGTRIASIRAAQQRFQEWCDRADGMYYADNFSIGGADLWADDPNLLIPGRAHVSINTPPVYVDVPAAMQAETPVENVRATDNTPEAREAAAALERIRVAWKAEEEDALKLHKACTVKALYGRTASFVYYDKDEKHPCYDVVEQPRNLWLGYKSDSYEEVEWAAYCQRMDPNAVLEEFGLNVEARADDDKIIPFIYPAGTITQGSRPWLDFGEARIEVWDYWYRKPLWRKGKFVKMETFNVTFAGNAVARGPNKYPEYKGRIPYLPLFNTFIPGMPDGRPELYDMEQIIREKFERITSGSQMIAAGTAGDYWQLVGPDAPSRVPATLKPARNQIIAPGPGNRVETITPFIAQFQLEQHLTRLDREATVVSGLNDILLGVVPVQALSSSKAVNALIANYESRISMRRKLLYTWIRKTWDLVVDIWTEKDETVREIVNAGGGTLDVISPSLNPRDELETATKAANLVNAKLVSQRTGMDMVGIDDPESEQDMIREERTDATMFPADVQVMAQLLAALQSLGIQAPQNAQAQAQAQVASGQNDLRTALGAATPDNTTSSQLMGDQGVMPPEAMVPGATPPGGAPFAQGPTPSGPSPVGLAQTMIQGGQAKSRILTQQQLGRR